MITQIDLRHFKCFRLLKLLMRPLTLLTGLNASGKSSVIQALVLLHQTMCEHEWSTQLALNGDTVQLGTAEDVIDKITGKRSFEIGLMDDVTMYRWEFEGNRTGMSLDVVPRQHRQRKQGKSRNVAPFVAPESRQFRCLIAFAG